MTGRRVRATVDHHDRLGGPRVQSRETGRHRRGDVLASQVAADLGVLGRADLTAELIDTEEGRR
ncbi:hypothetical protein [Gordonia neofelifaecis]|uniref:Uncharacterized protein n=1 Tax=Gordonia neofelifaecis NRRL B-59395 TaxID=644548 RepID=F1YE99_9ACTN|nr:hypothetical protein [Gordonia neofelifaecis]EGD56732.1 hypothetical protein SCNU_00100 [Gordonia neofelifaecis NRRL B-59395]